MTIALVREHAAAMRPPRALWVPFALGRPLGAPGDPAFQRRVLAAAFDLLARDQGPVLEDFSEPAPAASETGWACPIPLAAPNAIQDGSPRARLGAEIDRLAPWYETARRRRGWSTVGLLGSDIAAAADVLHGALHAPPSAGLDLRQLKYALEDLKAYYLEAAVDRPDRVGREQPAHWLWQQTELGEQMRALALRLAASEYARIREFSASSLVPREQQGSD